MLLKHAKIILQEARYLEALEVFAEAEAAEAEALEVVAEAEAEAETEVEDNEVE